MKIMNKTLLGFIGFIALVACQLHSDWYSFYQKNAVDNKQIYSVKELDKIFPDGSNSSQFFFGYIRIGWDGYHKNCWISDSKSTEKSMVDLILTGNFCNEFDIDGYGVVEGVYESFSEEIYASEVLYSGRISNISTLMIEGKKLVPK